MLRCPFPGCDYFAAHIILKSHAAEHGFTSTTELFKKHGRPRPNFMNTKAVKWAQEQSPQISQYQFDGVEAAIARMRKDDKKSR